MEINDIELKDVSDSEIEAASETLVPNKNIIDDLSVQLSVVIGTAKITVDKLYSLSAGQLLELEQSVDEPIKLFYKNKLVALGELVASGDRFGVKITQVSEK